MDMFRDPLDQNKINIPEIIFLAALQTDLNGTKHQWFPWELLIIVLTPATPKLRQDSFVVPHDLPLD